MGDGIDPQTMPGWDDRKALAGVWQEYAPLPEPGLSDEVYEALIAIAVYGWNRAEVA